MKSFLVYQLLLLVVGIWAWVRLLSNRRLPTAWKPSHQPLGPLSWRASDVVLFLLLLIIGISSVQWLSYHLFSNWISQRPETERQIWQVFVLGIGFHGGILLTVGVAHFLPGTGPLFSRYRPSLTAIVAALAAFFLVLPPLLLVSHLWSFLLRLVGRSTEPQELVQLLQNVDQIWPVLAAGILAVLIVPIAEEWIFRGILLRFLRNHLGRWSSIGISSIIFGVLHFNWFSLAPLIVLGLLLGWLYDRTGRLDVCIFLHAFFNANTMILLYLAPVTFS